MSTGIHQCRWRSWALPCLSNHTKIPHRRIAVWRYSRRTSSLRHQTCSSSKSAGHCWQGDSQCVWSIESLSHRYNWDNISSRLLKVYGHAMKQEPISKQKMIRSMWNHGFVEKGGQLNLGVFYSTIWTICRARYFKCSAFPVLLQCLFHKSSVSR